MVERNEEIKAMLFASVEASGRLSLAAPEGEGGEFGGVGEVTEEEWVSADEFLEED
jgi:hypothetical protein